MTLDDRIQTRIRYHGFRPPSRTDVDLYTDIQAELARNQAELTRLRALVDQLEDERDNLQLPKGRPLPPCDQPLTPREVSVLPYLIQGHTYKQIARALGISPATVKDYCSSLYAKHEVQNRAGLLGKLGVP